MRWETGTDGPPRGDWRHAEFVGPEPSLRGKFALVSTNASGDTVAQFDDSTTGYGFGWHKFDAKDFKSDEPSLQDGGPMHYMFLRGRSSFL